MNSLKSFAINWGPLSEMIRGRASGKRSFARSLQLLDALLVHAAVRLSAIRQGERRIYKQLLLPLVEEAGSQSGFLTDLRDWYLLNQMSAQQFLLFLCAPVSAFFRQASRSTYA